jgi:hypothetical protein
MTSWNMDGSPYTRPACNRCSFLATLGACNTDIGGPSITSELVMPRSFPVNGKEGGKSTAHEALISFRFGAFRTRGIVLLGCTSVRWAFGGENTTDEPPIHESKTRAGEGHESETE